MEKKESEIIGILKNIPVFQGLEDGDYRVIIPLLSVEKYGPETVIIREGTTGTSMCVIIHGTVKVTRKEREDTDEEIFLQALYAGSFFGEFSLIDNMPRSATVTTLEETELFRLEKRDFDVLLTRHQNIANLFYKNCLGETFSRFRNNISNLAFSQQILKEKTSALAEINRDLSEARKVQDFFINSEILDNEKNLLDGIRHSYIYRPCSQIGGDFLAVTKIDDRRAAIIIADIMGHGITAALVTGVIRSAFSLAISQVGANPARMMKFLNRHFYATIRHLYATCYYSVLDLEEKTLTFAKAGHPHPLFWKHRSQDFVEVSCNGTGLGLVKKPEYSETTMEFEKGDSILFYTDGIIEQQNENGNMYSETRLKSMLREFILLREKDIPHRLFEDLAGFAGANSIDDDVTMLFLEF